MIKPPTSNDERKRVIKRTVSASMFHRLGDGVDQRSSNCFL